MYFTNNYISSLEINLIDRDILLQCTKLNERFYKVLESGENSSKSTIKNMVDHANDYKPFDGQEKPKFNNIPNINKDNKNNREENRKCN